MATLINRALPWLIGLSAAAPLHAGTGYGQVSFQNNVNVTGHLYIDGNYGCGPVLMNLFCVTQVKEGNHTAYVKYDDGINVTFEPFYLEEGKVKTLTVNTSN